MQENQPTTSEGTERRFWGKSRGLKFGPKLSPNQRAKLRAELAPIAGTSCAIAPHWSRNSLPRRILDGIWRRDRKNEQRGAEKPILRKAAYRTDEMGPISGKYGFVLLRLRFTARRRRLTLFPAMILEITSSYGGIRSLQLKGSMRSPRVAQPWTTDSRGSEATRAC